ncbi:methyltransferase domain-containing protein [Aestuariibacter sp. GS-14]|uniref:class I SAM-dependent methyltransferase n=1 Tax=Aestuariibacter sp. GS-14 TaxID=2590670 RepID=UPI00112E5698|nr:methyltransferase domain-containing protein [Aestuariibacter sp. GS-14]TPV61957.1 methyltransferase domain-containing protein [Aestuariibacter sp. GS-14]
MSNYKNYEHITLDKVRHTCEICNSDALTEVVSWADFPFTEVYIPSDSYVPETYARSDLVLQYCESCTHCQLKNVVDQKLVYGEGSDYIFRSSQSYSARKSYETFLEFAGKVINNDSMGNVLEVGCNDLYMIQYMKDHFTSYTGIDPVLGKLDTTDLPDNCHVVADFFENVCLENTPDVVICKDVLEHVVEPFSFIEKLVEKGNDDTLFLVQVPIMETICSGRRFDQVFHQHLNYYSRHSFEVMLQRLNCSLEYFDINHFHWGVGLFAFKKGKATLSDKQVNLAEISHARDVFLQRMKVAQDCLEQQAGLGPLVGFGAGLMLSVYAYHIPALELLSFIIDDDETKHQTKCLHLQKKIKSSSDIDFSNVALILAAVSSRANVLKMMNKAIEWTPRNIINVAYEI